MLWQWRQWQSSYSRSHMYKIMPPFYYNPYTCIKSCLHFTIIHNMLNYHNIFSIHLEFRKQKKKSIKCKTVTFARLGQEGHCFGDSGKPEILTDKSVRLRNSVKNFWSCRQKMSNKGTRVKSRECRKSPTDLLYHLRLIGTDG